MRVIGSGHVCLVLIAFAFGSCGRPGPVEGTRAGGRRSTGSISATPNPIQVCGRGNALTGLTTLSWTSTGTTVVEVHVDSPAGSLFSRSGPSGSAMTGNWVVDGQVFYLQDVSNNEPLTPLTTLASVTIKHTSEGCP
jgi:hypothetical protein